MSLSTTLQERFEKWQSQRQPQELKMLDNYADMMRIDRSDDTKGTGISKSQKSKVFVGSTRSKIRSARAKIADVMFGAGKQPFDTSPTKEELRQFSDALETILSYQLDEGGFARAIKMGVDSIATYGTGFIFGPFVRNESHSEITAVQTPFGMQMVEQSMDYPCPYYEHARTLDVYPDPDAEDEQEGQGLFWSKKADDEFLRKLKGKPGYSDEAIDRALSQKKTILQLEGSELAEQLRANKYKFEADGRFWFQRFFGLVKKSELATWQDELATTSDDDEMVEAMVQMACGIVIKAEENPYKKKRRPVARCVYEDVEHEMWGVGIAENNSPHQRVTNAAFRLYLEGKAFSLLNMGSVDRSKFSLKEDFRFFPGKLFDFRPGLTPEERANALQFYPVPDVTTGWERVIEMSESFSDDDTGITKYTQGNDSSNLNKTATGVSMIMSASSLPLKEVISNIDTMWIEEIVESLIDWNMEYLEPEVVAKLLGEEIGQAWAAIKQFGKTSFMEWRATGSSTFMAKEVMLTKLQGFMQLALSNPITAPLVDARELLEQVWDAGEVGKESPIITADDLQKQQQSQQQGPQQMAAMQMQVEQAMKQQDQQFQVVLEKVKSENAQELAEVNGQIAVLRDLLKIEANNNQLAANLAAQSAHKLVDLATSDVGEPDGMMNE